MKIKLSKQRNVDDYKLKFAWFPTKVDDHLIWFEYYDAGPWREGQFESYRFTRYPSELK